MQIHREKFLALTATLAGFWPTAACTINLGGLTTGATLDITTTTDSTGVVATQDPTGEGSTAGTQGATEGTSGGTATVPTTGGTTGTASTDCCTAHGAPGCDDEAIEACVCAMDMYCCGLEGGTWDDTCVSEVNQFACGTCDADTGGTDTTAEGSTGGTGGTGSTGGTDGTGSSG